MELLSLVIVNTIITFIIYTIFSLRFRRAIQNIKLEEQLTPELKEYLEMTVKYIQASIDLLDQKTQACYQMLRVFEEQEKKKDKELGQGQDKIQEKISKNKISKQKKETLKIKKPIELEIKKPTQSFSAIENALNSLGEDILEISPVAINPKAAFLIGASEAHKNILRESRDDIKLKKRKKALKKPINVILKRFSKNTKKYLEKYTSHLPTKHKEGNQKEVTPQPHPTTTQIFIKDASNTIITNESARQKEKEIQETSKNTMRGLQIKTLNESTENLLSSIPKNKILDELKTQSTPPRNSETLNTLRNLIPEVIPQEKNARNAFVRVLIEEGYSKIEIASCLEISLAELNLMLTLPLREIKGKNSQSHLFMQKKNKISDEFDSK